MLAVGEMVPVSGVASCCRRRFAHFDCVGFAGTTARFECRPHWVHHLGGGGVFTEMVEEKPAGSGEHTDTNSCKPITVHQTKGHQMVGNPRQLSMLPDPIDEAFVTFHHQHPEIYRQLVEMTREWKKAGHESVGIKMFLEVLRWNNGRAGGATDRSGEWAVNNNFSSRYARLIMANERDLVGMFQTRQLLQAS